MAEQRTQRQLAAIMSVDVVGFSRLMSADEDGTLANLKRLQKTIVSPQVTHRNGRIVKLLGDGAIIMFSSVVDAGVQRKQYKREYHCDAYRRQSRRRDP